MYFSCWDMTSDAVQCHSILHQTAKGPEKINIGQIVEDPDGSLWITSSHGLLRVAPNQAGTC